MFLSFEFIFIINFNKNKKRVTKMCNKGIFGRSELRIKDGGHLAGSVSKLRILSSSPSLGVKLTKKKKKRGGGSRMGKQLPFQCVSFILFYFFPLTFKKIWNLLLS